MRPRVSHSLTLLLTTLITSLVLYPHAKASAEPEFGIRAEGYLGYSNLDIFFTELEAFQGGGTGRSPSFSINSISRPMSSETSWTSRTISR